MAGNVFEADDYVDYETGGTMNLTVEGTPYTIAVEEVYYNLAYEGQEAYIDIFAENSYLEAKCDAVTLNVSDYYDESDENVEGAWTKFNDALIGKAFTIGSFYGDSAEITLGALGTYPVVGGTMTMTSYSRVMDGVSKWSGTIELKCQTINGPASAPGTFSFVVEAY